MRIADSTAMRLLVMAGAAAFATWGLCPATYGVGAQVVAGVVGTGIVGSGIYLCCRPGEHVNAALVVLGGYLWIAGELGFRVYGPFPVIGELVKPLAAMALLVAFFRYPSARPMDRVEKSYLAATVPVVPLVNAYYVFTYAPFPAGYRPPPGWTFAQAGEPARQLAHDIRWGAIVLAALCGLLLIWRRYRRERGLQQREMTPIMIVGAALAVGLVLQGAIALVFEGRPAPAAADWFGVLSPIAIPLAMLLAAFLRVLDRSNIGAFSGAVRAGSATPVTVRDTLREALRDDRLALYVRDDATDRFVDAESGSAWAGDDGVLLLRRLSDSAGTPLALVVLDPHLARRSDVVEAALAAAALSLENLRLQTDLEQRLSEVRESRARIVEAGVTERRRVERDLHDGAQQRLFAIGAILGRASASAEDSRSRALIDEARDHLRAARAELRDLARGIHPAVLEQLGLAGAVQSVAEDMPLDITVHVRDDPRVPDTIRVTAYFVICEALTNAVKHANAGGATVEAGYAGNTFSIAVTDDGTGGAEPLPNGGLRGLRDRVDAANGRLLVSSPPGEGTRIEVDLPCG